MSYLDKLFEYCLTNGCHISFTRQSDIDRFLSFRRGKPLGEKDPVTEEQAEEVYKILTGQIPSEDITTELY